MRRPGNGPHGGGRVAPPPRPPPRRRRGGVGSRKIVACAEQNKLWDRGYSEMRFLLHHAKRLLRQHQPIPEYLARINRLWEQVHSIGVELVDTDSDQWDEILSSAPPNWDLTTWRSSGAPGCQQLVVYTNQLFRLWLADCSDYRPYIGIDALLMKPVELEFSLHVAQGDENRMLTGDPAFDQAFVLSCHPSNNADEVRELFVQNVDLRDRLLSSSAINLDFDTNELAISGLETDETKLTPASWQHYFDVGFETIRAIKHVAAVE
jgi:hypothetical protein